MDVLNDMYQPQSNPELEKDILEYQNAEKQLQYILLQRYQLQLQLNEIALAIDELKKAKGDVYKSIGGIMIKTTVQDAEKDLKEKKELFEIRTKTLAQQEEKLKAELLKLQEKIEKTSRNMTEKAF